MIRHIINYFDKLEDRIRNRLSHHPMVYAFIGGIGVVLFWRGVWDITGMFISPFVSLIASIVILMLTGTFVSFFIGEQIILSGLRQEKRIDEKTEEEVRREEFELSHLHGEIKHIQKDVLAIKHIIEKATL